MKPCGWSVSSGTLRIRFPRADAERATETLFGRWKKPVFLTRGPRGMLVRDGAGFHEVPGLQIVGRIDTVGAGDSALAGIAAALAAGADPVSAAQLGNFAAGVTVKKLFITGTASAEEILHGRHRAGLRLQPRAGR